MMRRLISVFCVLCLLAGTVCFGEELTDEMSRITLRVREQVGDTDAYEAFSVDRWGDRYDLYWSGVNGNMDVTCDADGTVLSMYRYAYGDRISWDEKLDVKFQGLDTQEIAGKAEEFLRGVLPDERFGYTFDPVREAPVTAGTGTVTVTGSFTYFGVPTDLTFFIEVDSVSGMIRTYSRSDAWRTYTALPDSEEPVVSAEEARALLDAERELKTVWCVTDVNEMANLVMRLKDETDYVVRVSDGAVLATDLYGAMRNDYLAEETAYEEDKGLGLTEAEIEGIASYANVLGFEKLDEHVRSVPQLNLSDASLNDHSWYLLDDHPMIRLSYEREDRDISVTADGVTGLIHDVMTWPWGAEEPDLYEEDADTETDEALHPAAEALLKGELSRYLSETGYTGCRTADPVTGSQRTKEYTLVRTYMGYPFEQNRIRIIVDPADDTVTGLTVEWDNGQEFTEPDGELITEDDARGALDRDLGLTLMYRSVPEPGQEGDELYTLTLAYCLTGDAPYAVNAVTGEAYRYHSEDRTVFLYEDTEGMLYPDEILRLGRNGIGLKDCGFTAQDRLDALQLMRLLLLAQGYQTDAETPEEIIDLFRNVFGTEVNPAEDGSVTRLELARVMTEAAGYGRAAALQGIYDPKLSDFDRIPAELQGAVAIAYALHMIDADEDNAVRAEEPALTAEAAHALYAWMSR